MGTDERWRLNRVTLRTLFLVLVLSFLDRNLKLCLCSYSEGVVLMKIREKIEIDPFRALSNWKGGETNHCSWFGVKCSDGKVVTLNLTDLCLQGTLAPEIGQLKKLKSLILRNNSFTGNVPKEIAELQELQILDLGCNNFTGLSEFHLNLSFITMNHAQLGNSANHRLLLADPLPPGNNNEGLQPSPPSPAAPPLSSQPPPSESSDVPPRSTPPPPSPMVPPGAASPVSLPAQIPPPPPLNRTSAKRPTSNTKSESPDDNNTTSPPSLQEAKKKNNSSLVFILVGVFGGVFFISAVVFGIIFFWNQSVSIKPWATGISGQLQKAFITGVPKLKLSELQAACEDFSNIVGSFSDGTIYKGTLSSGAEIAVTSTGIRSLDEWSMNLETQFADKINMLSKVNHKNFLNLIGYCQEDEPFARMMVFEYAPNGTLFEHLHVQEAEHLDWEMRLRIAMGIAYCLDHMHQLNPPIPHHDLQSSSVCLTEDNAAKIADFTCPYYMALPNEQGSSSIRELLEFSPADPMSNVYSFGVILYEMVTGKIPGSDYETDPLQENLSAREIADPTLKLVQEDVLERLIQVIRDCVDPDSNQRPTMSAVVAKLREITGIPPDGAISRLSPAWWAELEIISTEGI